MKKSIKGAAVGIGCLILVAGCFIGWFKFQTREMLLLDHAKLNDSLHVLEGDMSNMYLIGCGDGFIAVDASDNPEKLTAGCAALSVDPRAVKAVFLTHTDRDHVNGLTVFSNAVVYVPHDEELLLHDKQYRHFLGLQHKNSLPVADYKKISGADSVAVSGTIVHAIATPGHTRGSMCYRIGESLFSGDLCMLVRGSVEPFLPIFTEDMKTDSVSIRKIAAMDNVQHLYTAHSGFSDDWAGTFRKWR